MTIQINIGDHVSTQAGYIAYPKEYLSTIQWARTKAKEIAKTIPGANVYFKALPNGRSLTDLLGDNTIWINYHPTMAYYGETNFVGGKEIAISRTSCRIGKWTALATLIHELAHVDGAPGGVSQAAERAVLACGMGNNSELTTGIDNPRTPFDPRIGG